MVFAMDIPNTLDALLRRPASERLTGVREIPDLEWFISGVADHLSSAGGTALQDLGVALEICALMQVAAAQWASPIARVRMTVAYAHVLSYANRFDEALATLADAEEPCAGFIDTGDRARVRLGRVQPLARLGRFDEAMREAAEAARLFGEAGDTPRRARALSNLGILHRMDEHPDRALPYFDEALLSAGDETALIATIESNRAEALMDLHRFEEAAAAFERALARFEALGVRRAAAIVAGNLADLLGRQGRYAASLAQYERVMRTLEADRAPGDRARLDAERAEVFSAIGLYDDAVRSFRDAIAVLDRSGMASEAARARLGLGVALAASSDPSAAATELAEAALAFHRIGADRGRTRAYLGLARLAIRSGRTDTARELLERARLDDERPLEFILREHTLAVLLIAQGRSDDALDALTRAQRAADALGHEPLLAELLHTRATALSALGDRRAAIDALRSAVDHTERLRGALQADSLRAAFLSTRQQIYGDKKRLALELGGEEGVAIAFEMSERLRSRTLLDLVQHRVELSEHFISRASPADRPAIEALLSAQREMNALYRSMERGAVRDARAWTARVAEIDEIIGRTERRLAYTRDSAALSGRIHSLRQVRDGLPDGATLVEYFEHLGALHCFVVRRDGTTIRRLCAVHDAAASTELLRLQIGRAVHSTRRDPDHRSLRCSAFTELHQLLIEPIRDLLRDAHTLAFVPTGPLHSVPFSALTDLSGSCLVQSHRVVRAISASVMMESLADRACEPRRSLIAAYGDERAPGIEQEAAQIASTIGAEALVGQDATYEAIAAAAPELSLLHIAGHGVFDESAPMSASLRLADRWMTAREVFGLRLRGCDVVLGCCDAGRGAVVRGDELQGLTRAFLAAGARSLLAPLWPIEDDSAKRLLTRTYEIWHGGSSESLLDAITLAQREAIAAGLHARLWAPFQFVGSP